MPPQAKPGRVRYQPSSPTGTAGAAAIATGTLVTALSPRACHGWSVTVTSGPASRTAKSRRVSGPVQAVTRAWVSSPAREHHGLVPVSVQP